jgi:hypothetical protein
MADGLVILVEIGGKRRTRVWPDGAAVGAPLELHPGRST